jgi:hypothetical protein
MVRLFSTSLLAGFAITLGAGAYACSSSSAPATSDDSGVPSNSGSSSGAASGSSSGTASGSSSGAASGSSSGAASGSSSGGTEDAGADAGETFTDLYGTVLGPNGPYGCTDCHAVGSPDSFLDLGDASAAYASLAPDVHASGPKCGNGGTSDLRVEPGSPAKSLLWLKVWTLADGGDEVPCGVQMPKNPNGGAFSANPLNPTDEGKVKSWILYGAQNN